MIVDERSAGFFALGAAQATRRPVAVLCTSGTAAANLHPAVCEADEAGACPLIVLTADRPPELRGIGAGQTIDQLKLYGSAVRWFCEVGTHEADDAGLLHFRSVACRAFAAARGEPRPGPVHLNVAWRDPLGPEPRPGDVTATVAARPRGARRAAADRRRRRVDLEPTASLLDEVAERVVGDRRGPDRRRPPARTPGSREPLAGLAAAAGYPILAEPTSQLRRGAPRPLARRLAVRLRSPALRPPALEPELVIRFGDMPTSKPLRAWLASLGGLRQVVVDPASAGTSPPTGRRRSSAPTRPLAGRRARPRASRGDREDWRAAWLDAGRRARGGDRGRARRARGADRARRCTRRSARLYARRRSRLHRLVDADPRPGGVRSVPRATR